MAVLEEPPGVRSCRDGGDWQVCRTDQGAQFFIAELDRLADIVGPYVGALIRRELLTKMRAASHGRLKYGAARSGGDVEQMAAAQDVLELRLDSRTGGADDEVFLIRLFFSEPRDHPRALCALMLMWKRPGPLGVEEQTTLARTASRRLHEHLQRTV